MKPRSRLRHLLVLLAVVLVAVGAGAIVKATHLLRTPELASLDARFKLRGAQKPRPDVVIVGIDDRTLAATPRHAYPLNRARHAAVIKRLGAAGAAVIADEVQFTDSSGDDNADNALFDAVASSKAPVVLGTYDIGVKGATTIFGGGEGLKQSHAVPGNLNMRADADGRIRQVRFAPQGVENFGLAAARLKLGHRIDRPSGQGAPIDFPGAAGTIPQLSFADVEKGRFDPAAVRGKIVIIGLTAPALNDFEATATSRAMTGAEIQAAAAETALDGFPLHKPSPWVEWALIVALALVGPLVALRFGSVLAAGASLVAAAVFAVGAQIAFDHGTIVELMPPLTAAFAALVGVLVAASPTRSPRFERFVDRVSPGKGNARTRRLRAVLLLSAAGLVVTAALVGEATHALKRAELSTVDLRFGVRGKKPPPKSVALVAVDDKTFDLIKNRQWPYPRRWHAQVIGNLEKAGAKAIAVDIQFTEPTDDKNDNALIDEVTKAGNVVLSSTDIAGDGSTRIFGGGKTLLDSTATPASTIVPTDVDGKIRRLEFQRQHLTSFPVAAAEVALRRQVQTPKGNDAWIDYPGGKGSVEQLSYVDVLNNHFPASAIRGRVVVIGATQTSLQDQHGTSTTGSGLMPGPEIQADSIATVLAGFPLHNAAWWVDVLLIIVLGIAAPLAALRLGVLAAVLVGVAAEALLLVGAQWAFQDMNAIVVLVYPAIAGLLAILATAGIHGVTVAFEREQARDAFARFVPESVVDQVLADAEGVRLGGVRRVGTVMFSDLRGFTSFSETLQPEQVIESLNYYLTEMSEAILDHGGTLVAYMGDGIMAVFGAPLQQDDHADRALEAARDMLSRMDKFNGYLKEQGLNETGFKMGIGLNSGPVMSGNVGSERRLEYTALGDTTNTAARLEGMTKGTPHQLFISDTTREMLTRPADDLIQVGEAEVRGRVAKVMLWSLGGQPAPPPDPGVPVEATSQPDA